jgi:hypothetical protein
MCNVTCQYTFWHCSQSSTASTGNNMPVTSFKRTCPGCLCCPGEVLLEVICCCGAHYRPCSCSCCSCVALCSCCACVCLYFCSCSCCCGPCDVLLTATYHPCCCAAAASRPCCCYATVASVHALLQLHVLVTCLRFCFCFCCGCCGVALHCVPCPYLLT